MSHENVLSASTSSQGKSRVLFQCSMNRRTICTSEVYDEFRFEGDEFIDAGDSVVALGTVHVRGALSGAAAAQTGAVASRVCHGRVITVRAYLDRDAALEAVGLRE